jgi:putative transcriptional regulator
MGEKKVRIADVARATGIHRLTIANLYHEKHEGISFKTLERLCEYFGCGVGDLLEYIPEPATEAKK